LQYKELFDVNLPMQEVIDKELHTYLFEILKLLHEEKLASINTIDSFIAIITNITAIKECLNCNQKTSRIESKHV